MYMYNLLSVKYNIIIITIELMLKVERIKSIPLTITLILLCMIL